MERILDSGHTFENNTFEYDILIHEGNKIIERSKN